LVDHIVIKDLVLLIVLVVFAPFEQNSFYLFPSVGLAAVEIVKTTLDEEFVEVHLESCPF